MAAIPRFDRLSDAPDWIRDYYRLRLEIELRNVDGRSFQSVFDQVMRCIHGSDYQDTAAIGDRGDQGCDGYLKSRNVVFACYGPHPYFKLGAAITKLRKDFARASECWTKGSGMDRFVFVFNYPGKHADLIQAARELDTDDVEVSLWSRVDIVEQFMMMSNGSRLKQYFGEVPARAKSKDRAYLTHEATTLPRIEADILFRIVRAQATCDKEGVDRLRSRWCKLVAEDAWACLVAGVHALICSIAAYIEAGFEPEYIDLSMLRYQSGMPEDYWDEHGERTWELAMNLIWGVGGGVYAESAGKIGGDFEKLIGTIASCEKLLLGFARMLARESGYFETDSLDEIWRYAGEIVIHPD
ncbi:hypothetical protein [Nocardia cyriacigeorgica]|uniref:hypothetical protein n=1 Tax=Nocardia cyriacigeorgica TaxID=135487 RepID=UPI0035171878